MTLGRIGNAEIGDVGVSIDRTSGVTNRRIIDTNVTAWVEYTGYGVALFGDVMITKGGILHGNSGAPLYIKK